MMRKFLVTLVAAGVALPALSGCLWRLHRAHMRAHRAVHAAIAHHWVYYPHSHVYHCTKTGWWWHRNDRGAWVRVKVLPPRFHLRNHVVIKHTAAEPWRHHDDHVREYR